jgi:hypothetical protein
MFIGLYGHIVIRPYDSLLSLTPDCRELKAYYIGILFWGA